MRRKLTRSPWVLQVRSRRVPNRVSSEDLLVIVIDTGHSNERKRGLMPYSESGKDFAETFMDEIRKEATTKGATKSTKLTHWAQYKARKGVRGLPKTALSG